MSATPDDVETSLGRSLTDVELGQVVQWIADAELLIAARLGDVAELNQDVLEYVEREAVLARLRNPDGYQSETIDDYTYRLPDESRRITILPEWWDLLTPGEGGARIYSVRPGFEADTVQWSADRRLTDDYGWPIR